MAKKEIGILINPHTGAEHEYTLAHAWAIMDMQRNGGWTWKGEAPPRPGEVLAKAKTTKKGKNANRSGTATATVKGTQAADEDCGCH